MNSNRPVRKLAIVMSRSSGRDIVSGIEVEEAEWF
jgi:hypothetical protein